AALRTAMAERDRAAVEKAAEALDKKFENVLPPQNSLREWTETIVASIVVVGAFRAYFLQPFQIPTGSMQPSLNGLITHRVESSDALPRGPQRWLEELMGRSYVDVVAPRDDKVRALEAIKVMQFFDATRIIWQSGRVDTVGIPYKQLQTYGDGF